MNPQCFPPCWQTPWFSPGGYFFGAQQRDVPSLVSPPQYFEYTSQRELRHNIGKELCLRASSGSAELGACQYRGKPGRVPASEEWDLVQVRRCISIPGSTQGCGDVILLPVMVLLCRFPSVASVLHPTGVSELMLSLFSSRIG